MSIDNVCNIGPMGEMNEGDTFCYAFIQQPIDAFSWFTNLLGPLGTFALVIAFGAFVGWRIRRRLEGKKREHWADIARQLKQEFEYGKREAIKEILLKHQLNEEWLEYAFTLAKEKIAAMKEAME